MTRKRKAPSKVELVPIDYERLRSLSRQVQLEDVQLVRLEWRSVTTTKRLGLRPEEMRYGVELRDAAWDIDSSVGLLEIGLGYRVAAFAELPDGKTVSQVPLFQLECGWHVLYQVESDFTPEDDETMADFAVANGQLNAFPYVRQSVQDITGRAGWPPLVLPVFRAPARRRVDQGQRRNMEEIQGQRDRSRT